MRKFFVAFAATYIWAASGCSLRGSDVQTSSDLHNESTDMSPRFSAINNFLSKRFPSHDQLAKGSDNTREADDTAFTTHTFWTSHFFTSYPTEGDSESSIVFDGNEILVVPSSEIDGVDELDRYSSELESGENIDEISPAEDIYVAYGTVPYAADYPDITYGIPSESYYTETYAYGSDVTVSTDDANMGSPSLTEIGYSKDSSIFMSMGTLISVMESMRIPLVFTISTSDREMYYIDGGISSRESSLCG